MALGNYGVGTICEVRVIAQTAADPMGNKSMVRLRYIVTAGNATTVVAEPAIATAAVTALWTNKMDGIIRDDVVLGAIGVKKWAPEEEVEYIQDEVANNRVGQMAAANNGYSAPHCLSVCFTRYSSMPKRTRIGHTYVGPCGYAIDNNGLIDQVACAVQLTAIKNALRADITAAGLTLKPAIYPKVVIPAADVDPRRYVVSCKVPAWSTFVRSRRPGKGY